MAEAAHIEETTSKKIRVNLEPPETIVLSNLLDRILKKSGKRYYSDELGRFTHLQRTDALLLNEVYKQLEGKDHPDYTEAFGSTILPANNPEKSNTIDMTKTELQAISKLVRWELDPKNPKNRSSLIGLLIRHKNSSEENKTLVQLSKNLKNYMPKPPLDFTKIPAPPVAWDPFSHDPGPPTMVKNSSDEPPPSKDS